MTSTAPSAAGQMVRQSRPWIFTANTPFASRRDPTGASTPLPSAFAALQLGGQPPPQGRAIAYGREGNGRVQPSLPLVGRSASLLPDSAKASRVGGAVQTLRKIRMK